MLLCLVDTFKYFTKTLNDTTGVIKDLCKNNENVLDSLTDANEAVDSLKLEISSIKEENVRLKQELKATNG